MPQVRTTVRTTTNPFSMTSNTSNTSNTSTVPTTCFECMHYESIKADDMAFGADALGVCQGRGGVLISKSPTATDTDRLSEVAGSCPVFSAAEAAVLLSGSVEIGTSGLLESHPMVFESNGLTYPTSMSGGDELANCFGCANFISPVDAHTLTGLAAIQGCRVTGKIMDMDMATTAHKACAMASNKAASATPPSLHPIYDWMNPNKGSTTTPAKEEPVQAIATVNTERSFVEPTEFGPGTAPEESWLEASDEAKAQGIRIWRKVGHPTRPSKTDLYLPIFETSHFSQAEQALIPKTGEKYNPQSYLDLDGQLVYKTAVNMVGRDKAPLMLGPSGTGKTEFYAYLAWMMNLPFHRISITDTTEVWDLVGKEVLVNKDGVTESEWHDGRLVKGWQRPCVLLIDEGNTGQDAVWQLLRPLTDNSTSFALDQDNGRIVERDDWCLLAFAANPDWDATYMGVRPFSEADVNRLGVISVDYPARDVEHDIIIERLADDGQTIGENDLGLVLDLVASFREMTGLGQLTFAPGVRMSVTIAGYLEYLTLTEAVMMAVGDRLDPAQREQVLSVVKGLD